MKPENKQKIDDTVISDYFGNMINRIFKILPIREQSYESLPVYIESLLAELTGCGRLIDGMEQNALFLSLLSVLQFLADGDRHSVRVVKREVFKAIEICEKLQTSFFGGGAE